MVSNQGEEAILFYRTSDPYGEFSNFSKHPIEIDGMVWPTSEHYFQARKYADPVRRDEVRSAKTAMIAAQMGRDQTIPIRADWDAVKDDVMREAVLAKFSQHAALRELLLATGIRPIVEHTTNDSYWADAGDGSGMNRLGAILMEVREALRRS